MMARGKSQQSTKSTTRDADLSESKETDEPPDGMRFRVERPWEDPALTASIPFRKIVRAFSGDVLKHKSKLLQALSAFFVASLMGSMVPLSTKLVIDYFIPSRSMLLLCFTAGFVLLLFLLRALLNALAGHLLIFTSLHIVFDVRRRLFEHLQLLHLAFYERSQSGKLVSKLINDAMALQTLIQGSLPTLSVNVFNIVLTFGLMFVISPRLTLFSMLVLPAYMLVHHLFRTRLYRRSREVRERRSVVAGNVNEVITGIKVVKSFGMENQEHRRFVNMIRENLDYEIDLGTVHTLHGNTLDFITGMARAGIIVIGGSMVISDSGGTGPAMTVGDYVAFTAFLMTLFGPIMAIANVALQVVDARTGLERILNLLNIAPRVVDRPGAEEVTQIIGRVELKDVSFAYDTGGRVLNQVNVEARPGEVVALVGPSGSGKSTVANLLTRFYDVTEGQILVDGKDLRDLQLASYRRRVGIVLQEPFLFSGTIRDNICYGCGRARQEEVEEAARQANALEFINELPEGFNTQVGERGQLLSGGQRQRVSIARALLKDPDILILDEATSALDTQSERLVQQALDRLMRGRTVFVIAHRLTTVRNADKIVVLDRGNIVEQGNHTSLMAGDGLYRSLYAQSLDVPMPEEAALVSAQAAVPEAAAGGDSVG